MQLTSLGVSMQRVSLDERSSHSKAVVKSYRLSSKTVPTASVVERRSHVHCTEL